MHEVWSTCVEYQSPFLIQKVQSWNFLLYISFHHPVPFEVCSSMSALTLGVPASRFGGGPISAEVFDHTLLLFKTL